MSPALITLKDVNIESLQLSFNGRSLTAVFIDMCEGNPIGRLECDGLIAFNFHNAMEVDDALPCYVGEVSCMQLSAEEYENRLNRMGYGFLGRGVELYNPSGSEVWWVHIEGGEVSIHIICISCRWRANAPAR